MTKLTSQQESMLMSAVEKAAEFINSGSTPTEALKKVAEDNKLNPEFISRISEAINVSLTRNFHKNAQNKNRASTFDLADANQVIKSIYTPVVKEAKDISFYSGSPKNYNGVVIPEYQPLEKQATDWSKRDVTGLLLKESLSRRALSTKIANVNTKLFGLKEKLHQKAAELITEFRKWRSESFADFEKQALALYPNSEPFLDYVFVSGGLKKIGHSRADKEITRETIIDDRAKVFQILKEAIDIKNQYAKLSAEVKWAQHLFKEAEEKLAQEAPSVFGTLSNPFAVADMGIRPLTQNSNSFSNKAIEDSFMQDAQDDLVDVEHNYNMRKLKAKAVLNDLMVNDPVVSDFDEGEVINAFNYLSQTAPRLVDNPAALQAGLRRILGQGALAEPFEVAQLLELENSMKRREQPVTVVNSRKGGDNDHGT